MANLNYQCFQMFLYVFQHEDAKYNKWDELTRRAVRVAKIVMDAYNKEIQKIREKYLAISK